MNAQSPAAHNASLDLDVDVSDLDIDELMDRTIDDLADFVPFEPFPIGSYLCQFSYEKTTVGDKDLPTVKATFTLQEVVELAEKDAVPPEEGRKFVKSYILVTKDGKRNAISEGQLKSEILQPLKEVFGGEKTSEILHNGDGCVMALTLGIRKRKNKETGEVQSENTIKASAVAQ